MHLGDVGLCLACSGTPPTSSLPPSAAGGGNGLRCHPIRNSADDQPPWLHGLEEAGPCSKVTKSVWFAKDLPSSKPESPASPEPLQSQADWEGRSPSLVLCIFRTPPFFPELWI